MARAWNTRLAAIGIAALVGAALVLGGCADRNDGKEAAPKEAPPAAGIDPSSQGGGAVSVSSVAPNTFLTFEGKRYRLVDLAQADLVDKDAFGKIGAATAADIDQDDLTVYRKAGDSAAVYTYSGAPQGVAAQPIETDGGSTPALWYRWTPEP